jgi:WD40 repeat protein
VYCVTRAPHAPYNTFISGDGNDKCYIWAIRPRTQEEEKGEHFPGAKENNSKYECCKIGELPGHSETVEFIKFNHDGKFCLTGGMNNTLKIWSVDVPTDPMAEPLKMTLKCELTKGPAEGEDILCVEWHPKGNAVLCGGKDYSLYLLNGATGDFLALLGGHEDEVL